MSFRLIVLLTVSALVVAATLILGFGLLSGWSPWLSTSGCEECRVPSAVFEAIARDPALLPLAGASNGPIRGGPQCGDSGTQTGVWRAYKREDRNTKALVDDLARRAVRLGWKVQERPLALAWLGTKQTEEADVQLSLFVAGLGSVEAGVDAYCTEK